MGPYFCVILPEVHTCMSQIFSHYYLYIWSPPSSHQNPFPPTFMTPLSLFHFLCFPLIINWFNQCIYINVSWDYLLENGNLSVAIPLKKMMPCITPTINYQYIQEAWGLLEPLFYPWQNVERPNLVPEFCKEPQLHTFRKQRLCRIQSYCISAHPLATVFFLLPLLLCSLSLVRCA